MSSNINHIKIKLTIIFSIMVFSLFLFLGFIFFTSKYIKNINFEKNNFENFVYSIEKGNTQLGDFLRIGNFRFENQNEFRRIESRSPRDFHLPKFLVNYLYLNENNELLLFNIVDDVDSDFLDKVLISNEKYINKTLNVNSFYIKTIDFSNNGKLILFKKNNYSFYNYLNEMLGFLIINFLFSFLIYYLGLKFANKVFIPIEENIKDMNDFIHNAGHEFKTPLSVIDSNIQLILDKNDFDKNLITEIKTENLRLNGLIDSLIKLSIIDLYKEKESINLNDILDNVIKNYKNKITEKNIKINKNIDDNIFIKSDRDYLYIFLSNIIGNAIKYNKINGEINIFLKNGTLKIVDTGIGISNNDIDNIWDRFFKVDKSRNSEGFGIGLSLVKKISDIYGWKIKVNSDINKGTEFLIDFKNN